MGNPTTTLLTILAVGLVFVVIPIFIDAYARYRSPRRVLCPEDGNTATVSVDPWRAVLTSVFAKQQIRVNRCTLWRNSEGCHERCTRQM